MKRNVYLLICIPLVALLFIVFMISNGLNLKEIDLYNWVLGLVGAVLAGAFVVKNVLSQPSSERQTGIAFATDVIYEPKTTGQVPPHYED